MWCSGPAAGRSESPGLAAGSLSPRSATICAAPSAVSGTVRSASGPGPLSAPASAPSRTAIASMPVGFGTTVGRSARTALRSERAAAAARFGQKSEPRRGCVMGEHPSAFWATATVTVKVIEPVSAPDCVSVWMESAGNVEAVIVNFSWLGTGPRDLTAAVTADFEKTFWGVATGKTVLFAG